VSSDIPELLLVYCSVIAGCYSRWRVLRYEAAPFMEQSKSGYRVSPVEFDGGSGEGDCCECYGSILQATPAKDFSLTYGPGRGLP